jgi:hypothetical protein
MDFFTITIFSHTYYVYEKVKTSCKLEIYHYQYAISGYGSNEVSNIYTLHESKLGSRSRTREQFFVSAYRVYICECFDVGM